MGKKRTHRKPNRTSEQITREKAIREKFQRERPSLDEVVATGTFTDPVTQGEYWDVMEAVRQLKHVRVDAGLSLADMAERTGMDRAAISRLENGVFDNPTIKTLSRYARALDKRLVVKFI